jgi:transcriptional regulator with XRE-family HTH domain
MTMVGERIRQTRQARRLSLNDVAERAKVSVATLSRIERDKQGLELGLFLLLCRILKASPQELIGGGEESDNIDPLAVRIAALHHDERVQLWHDLAAGRRGERRHAIRARTEKLREELEELMAQLEFVRAEMESVHSGIRRR